MHALLCTNKNIMAHTFMVGKVKKNTPDTVQGKIEAALAIFLPEKPEIVGCGRTDTGVHASDYFFSFRCG